METIDLYSTYLETSGNTEFRIPKADLIEIEQSIKAINAECALKEAASWKAAQEIVLTD